LPLARGFQRFYLLLPFQLGRQRQRGFGLTLRLPDLPVKVLDLPFKSVLQVARPAFQLLGLLVEVLQIAGADVLK
jgi:hypothetical protein